ncbi:Hypothetical predicted protein, partial [Olea europaea subsp. europaea]
NVLKKATNWNVYMVDCTDNCGGGSVEGLSWWWWRRGGNRWWSGVWSERTDGGGATCGLLLYHQFVGE